MTRLPSMAALVLGTFIPTAVLAEEPVVFACQRFSGEVEIEDQLYGTVDALRAKVNEIRARNPQPTISSGCEETRSSGPTAAELDGLHRARHLLDEAGGLTDGTAP